MNKNYDQYYAIETEGGRRGIVTCLRCGALVLIDDDTNATLIHDMYHEEHK